MLFLTESGIGGLYVETTKYVNNIVQVQNWSIRSCGSEVCCVFTLFYKNLYKPHINFATSISLHVNSTFSYREIFVLFVSLLLWAEFTTGLSKCGILIQKYKFGTREFRWFTSLRFLSSIAMGMLAIVWRIFSFSWARVLGRSVYTRDFRNPHKK
jgi:hypothetical protein